MRPTIENDTKLVTFDVFSFDRVLPSLVLLIELAVFQRPTT
jgi:hypothetical protein